MTEYIRIENDFSTAQNNLDCIEPNLLLGNLSAATDVQLLKEKEINFILTVNSFPLPEKVSCLENITVKFIEVSDTPRDDLLSHFEETFNFIDYGVRNGVVLVHCCHGVSRSTTIVLSYLMRKKSMTLQSTLEYVKSKRASIGPNSGFLSQLQLYESMNFCIDKNNTQYKMFRLFIAKKIMQEERILPDFYSDVIKPDPSHVKSELTVYKCKKCRRILALDSNIIPHAFKEKYSWEDRGWSEDSKKAVICQKSYFFEPLSWMENVSDSLEGKLSCPNERCRSKLGSFSWVTGCLCPCGTKVSPGFYIIPSKVDKLSQNFQLKT